MPTLPHAFPHPITPVPFVTDLALFPPHIWTCPYRLPRLLRIAGLLRAVLPDYSWLRTVTPLPFPTPPHPRITPHLPHVCTHRLYRCLYPDYGCPLPTPSGPLRCGTDAGSRHAVVKIAGGGCHPPRTTFPGFIVPRPQLNLYRAFTRLHPTYTAISVHPFTAYLNCVRFYHLGSVPRQACPAYAPHARVPHTHCPFVATTQLPGYTQVPTTRTHLPLVPHTAPHTLPPPFPTLCSYWVPIAPGAHG